MADIRLNQVVYSYPFPPWAMLSPDPIQSSECIRKKTGLSAIAKVGRIEPHLGQNIDQYV